MSHLEVSINDGIATLTMNRPEARNALSMEMRSELCTALLDVEIDASVRCVVLKGAGDHFMAGGDIKGMGETIKKSADQIKKEFMHFGRVEYPKIIQKPMTILLAKHNT